MIGKGITFFPVTVETRTCLPTKSRTSAATQAKSLSSTQTLEPLRRLIFGYYNGTVSRKNAKSRGSGQSKIEIETLRTENGQDRDRSREEMDLQRHCFWRNFWVPALTGVDLSFSKKKKKKKRVIINPEKLN